MTLEVGGTGLPEGSHNAQLGFIQADVEFGVVHHDPVVTGQGNETASRRAGPLAKRRKGRVEVTVPNGPAPPASLSPPEQGRQRVTEQMAPKSLMT